MMKDPNWEQIQKDASRSPIPMDQISRPEHDVIEVEDEGEFSQMPEDLQVGASL